MTFFAFSGANAIELDDVRLLEISSLERSIALDRGELDNYKAGEQAKFFIQIGDKDKPRIFYVAEGELIKSFPSKSFWYLKKIAMPNLLYSQSHLLMMTSSGVRLGRRERKIRRKHIVFSEKEYGNVDQYLEENKKGVPEKLILQEDNFSNSGALFEKEIPIDEDLAIQSYELLQKSPTEELSNEYSDSIGDQYFVGKKLVELTRILSADDKKLLDSMGKQYLEKNKQLKYGLTHGLYRDQQIHTDRITTAKKITMQSVYDSEKETERVREQIDPRLNAKIKRDGINWSNDMDDQTLRNYFITTGIAEERNRKERVLNEREGHEFMLHYTGSLVDHTTTVEQFNRALGYNLGLSYDLHLARTSPELKFWSVQFSLEYGLGHYDLGGMNGSSQEVIYGGILNYYIYNNPLTLNKFIYELGLGLKAGQSNMTGSALAQQYTYQILSFPTVQFLTKYRFRVGDENIESVKIGSSIYAGVIMEHKRLSTVTVPLTPIKGVITVNDVNFQIGMGFYF
jgi:hypothetical protein